LSRATLHALATTLLLDPARAPTPVRYQLLLAQARC